MTESSVLPETPAMPGTDSCDIRKDRPDWMDGPKVPWWFSGSNMSASMKFVLLVGIFVIGFFSVVTGFVYAGLELSGFGPHLVTFGMAGTIAYVAGIGHWIFHWDDSFRASTDAFVAQIERSDLAKGAISEWLSVAPKYFDDQGVRRFVLSFITASACRSAHLLAIAAARVTVDDEGTFDYMVLNAFLGAFGENGRLPKDEAFASVREKYLEEVANRVLPFPKKYASLSEVARLAGQAGLPKLFSAVPKEGFPSIDTTEGGIAFVAFLSKASEDPSASPDALAKAVLQLFLMDELFQMDCEGFEDGLVASMRVLRLFLKTWPRWTTDERISSLHLDDDPPPFGMVAAVVFPLLDFRPETNDPVVAALGAANSAEIRQAVKVLRAASVH